MKRMNLGTSSRFSRALEVIKNNEQGKYDYYQNLLDLSHEEIEEELYTGRCPHEFEQSSDEKADIPCNCPIDDCIKCWQKP